MKTYITIVFFLCIPFLVYAHQPEISSTVIAQKENNVWILQVSASLTAFQQEINAHFSETPYQTPEQFQEMVLSHLNNNLFLQFNGDTQISLDNGVVHLGHETKVIFEVVGIPEDIQSINIKNTSFSDIYRSKSLMVILKEGVEKNKFILDEANDYTKSLSLEKDSLVEVKTAQASIFSWPLFLLVIGLIGLGVFMTRYKNSKSVNQSSSRVF